MGETLGGAAVAATCCGDLMCRPKRKLPAANPITTSTTSMRALREFTPTTWGDYTHVRSPVRHWCAPLMLKPI